MSVARKRRRAGASAPANQGRNGGSAVRAATPGGVREPSLVHSLFAGRGLWVSVALIISTILVYAPVWGYQFVEWDDPRYVSANPIVLSGLNGYSLKWALTTNADANWFPLTWISLMFDAQLYGLHAGGYHITNLLLHMACTLLLFGFFYEVTHSLAPSGFVAALFALHPMHVESVAWVAERKDVLSTLFWMLTMCAYVSYVRRPSTRRYALVFVFFAMGLMSKPMLVTLPLVLLLLDYWPLHRFHLEGRTLFPLDPALRTDIGKLVWEKVPLFVLVVISSIVTFIVQRQGGAVQGLETFPLRLRLANALLSYVAYIGKMLWPTRLAAYYRYPPSFPIAWILGAAVLLLAISILAIRMARQRPYFIVGWLWYLGTLVPVIGLIQVGSQAMADRYSYIPLTGLFIVLVWGAFELPAQWLRGAGIAGMVVVLACAAKARAQVRYWTDGVALWRHALEIDPDSELAHNNLGEVYWLQRQFPQAAAEYSEAVRIRPSYAAAQNNLGLALANQGKTAEAISHYMAALQLNPNYAAARANLGAALWADGKVDHAIVEYQTALKLMPTLPEAHSNLGIALASQGKFDEAVEQYTQALQLRPDYVEALYNLGNARREQGKLQEAVASYQQSLQIQPGYGEAHLGLGSVLLVQGKPEEAIAEYKEALRLKPDSAEAHNRIGAVLSAQGKPIEAVAEYSEAIRLKPDYAEAHNNLGLTLENQGRIGEAMDHYSEALRLRPQYAEAHDSLANVLLAQGRLDEAIAHYREAIRIKPDYALAHNNLGVALMRQGKNSEALDEFNAARRINPGLREAQEAARRLSGRGSLQ